MSDQATTRRVRIDQLLGEERLPGTMESTWEYHGVRYVAALVLATLEVADSLTDIADTIRRSTTAEPER